MEPSKFESAIAKIDRKNAEDPHTEVFQDREFPKELLYSQRMSLKLLMFNPDASEALRIAARAQHICRWKIERNAYPMDKIGYIKWREKLKKMHADITAEILKDVGYNSKFIDRVSFLIRKKSMKKDEGTQILEDVICLVFLEHYFEDFASKHPDDKVVDILKKTWKKMSAKGHSEAKKLHLSSKGSALLKKATGAE